MKMFFFKHGMEHVSIIFLHTTKNIWNLIYILHHNILGFYGMVYNIEFLLKHFNC